MSSNILQSHEIPTKIIDIIKSAKEYCFIVTPYFQPWNQLLKVLQLADNEEKLVAFFFRDDQTNRQSVAELQWNFNFDVYFIENLHAKIYLNERQALIASMNLYDCSKENNFEIGYHITNTMDVKHIAKDLVVGEMLSSAWLQSFRQGRYHEYINPEMFNSRKVKSNETKKVIVKQERSTEGSCIRCGESLPFNPERPFCYSCFQKWNLYQNPDYQEVFCHCCGNQVDSSANKPLCYTCFSKIGMM